MSASLLLMLLMPAAPTEHIETAIKQLPAEKTAAEEAGPRFAIVSQWRQGDVAWLTYSLRWVELEEGAFPFFFRRNSSCLVISYFDESRKRLGKPVEVRIWHDAKFIDCEVDEDRGSVELTPPRGARFVRVSFAFSYSTGLLTLPE